MLQQGWAGPRADPPRSPAFPAAAGTDVAAVRAAILWERNQRLAWSSSLAAAAEGEAAGRGPGAGWRAAGACQGYATHCPLPRRKGVEGCGEDGPGGGRGEAGAVRPEAGPGAGAEGRAGGRVWGGCRVEAEVEVGMRIEAGRAQRAGLGVKLRPGGGGGRRDRDRGRGAGGWGAGCAGGQESRGRRPGQGSVAPRGPRASAVVLAPPGAAGVHARKSGPGRGLPRKRCFLLRLLRLQPRGLEDQETGARGPGRLQGHATARV